MMPIETQKSLITTEMMITIIIISGERTSSEDDIATQRHETCCFSTEHKNLFADIHIEHTSKLVDAVSISLSSVWRVAVCAEAECC